LALTTEKFSLRTFIHPDKPSGMEQARNQALRFEGQNAFLGGKIFVFIICLKQIFLSTTKFGGAQKIFRGF